MPSKYYFLLLTCLFACSKLTAQSLYNFKFNYLDDNGNKEYYNAFMVRYDDGTGFIRASYIDSATGEKYLVNMDMEESYEVNDMAGAADSSILYFEGIDPKVIMGDTTYGYDPDIFVFQNQENSEYYEPLKVLSVSDDGSMVEGEFTESKLLTQEDLTEEFVLQFFSEDEEFYQNLFNTTVRTLTSEEKQAKLHLLIVANTKDVDIGSTCVLDKDRTLKTFSDLADLLSIKLDAKTIFGDDYNKKNVEDAVASLNPSPRDIVVFYYSGHGFSMNDGHQFPYMELRAKSFQSLKDNSLNIEDIYNIIAKKGARVNLVISDCCNADPNAGTAISGDFAQTRSSSIEWSLQNCQQLFIPPQRVSILMTAAQKGELSAGNNNFGGFFTYNFRASLVNFLSPVHQFTGVSWDNLIEEAKAQTIAKADHTWCSMPDGGKAKCVQHPAYVIQH
ncbi:MAG: caspase family protein [Ginsengibacter sp.]